MPRQIEQDLQLTRPVGSLAREAALNLYRTEQFVTTRLEAALRPADLRLDEFNVLRIIRGGGADGHPRAEIERRMLHSPDRLLAMVHKRKTRGLVEGTLRLSLTAEGAALLARVDPGSERALEGGGQLDPRRAAARGHRGAGEHPHRPARRLRRFR